MRVTDRRLAPVCRLERLVEIELPNRFSHEEFLALHRALPRAKGFWFDAHARGKQQGLETSLIGS